MTNEEKAILIKSLNSSINSVRKLKFKYIGHARNFAEAMYLQHTRALIAEDLNDFLEIDKTYLTRKFDDQLNQLENLIQKIEKL